MTRVGREALSFAWGGVAVRMLHVLLALSWSLIGPLTKHVCIPSEKDDDVYGSTVRF